MPYSKELSWRNLTVEIKVEVTPDLPISVGCLALIDCIVPSSVAASACIVDRQQIGEDRVSVAVQWKS